MKFILIHTMFPVLVFIYFTKCLINLTMDGSHQPTCLELATEGERLCKLGEYSAGVQYLEAAVNQGTDDVTTLSAIYMHLGNAYQYLGDFMKALQYHQHDRTLARTIDDLEGEAKASSNISNTLKLMGRFDEAIVCCQRHLDIAIETNNKVWEAKALYQLANIHHEKAKQKCKSTAGIDKVDPNAAADLKVAVKLYEQNLSLVRTLNDRAAQGKTCGSLGNINYLLGNCDEAIKFHTERLSIAKEFGDKAAQRRAYTNLGNAHIVLGEYQVAADFYLQTLSISRQLGDRAFEAQACYSLGSTYTLLGDYNRAIEYHMRHKQIAQDLSDRVGVGRACWLLSNAHISLGNYKKALELTTLQLQISKEAGDEAGRATAEKNLGRLESLSSHNGAVESNYLDQELPRVRRMSMENMELLQLTPEQVKAINEKKLKLEEGRSLQAAYQANIENLDVVNSNGNRALDAEQVEINIQPPQQPQGNEHFFDLLTRLQGRRMDDQRAEMRNDGYELPDFLRQDPPHEGRQEQAAAAVPDNVVAENNDAGPMACLTVGPHPYRTNEPYLPPDEHHERMNTMISMLARSQSKRLNEQRVSLSSLPGLRINGRVYNVPNNLPGGPPNDDGNNNAQEPPRALDDNFFDNLMRCQGTRLNDQRTSAPSGDQPVYRPPTIPDEDFMSLIVRLQSSRINDQRCRFEPE
uniref:G-protein-signaling modulator 2 isoform X2 n=1 Tax=Ciona intestinalis TaxID=7719 RepID=UPI00089DB875|nr:G-protein-signaling modulator 2 isoform X2 [Ciona intestinalis]|eukprot:XP_018672346.1 G-protein-signaling modulator 2 isoform X2 [Ciona intestinalis]